MYSLLYWLFGAVECHKDVHIDAPYKLAVVHKNSYYLIYSKKPIEMFGVYVLVPFAFVGESSDGSCVVGCCPHIDDSVIPWVEKIALYQYEYDGIIITPTGFSINNAGGGLGVKTTTGTKVGTPDELAQAIMNMPEPKKVKSPKWSLVLAVCLLAFLLGGLFRFAHAQPVDDYCKAMAVYHETRGATPRDRAQIAKLVNTRVRDLDTTACAVVAEKGQFEWYRHPAIFPKEAEAWKTSLTVAHMHRNDTTAARYVRSKKEYRPSIHNHVVLTTKSMVYYWIDNDHLYGRPGFKPQKKNHPFLGKATRKLLHAISKLKREKHV